MHSAPGRGGGAPLLAGSRSFAGGRPPLLFNAPHTLCSPPPSLSCWVISFYFTIFFFHVQSLFKNFYFSATGDMQYDISFSVRRVILSVCGSRHATGRLACNEDGPTG